MGYILIAIGIALLIVLFNAIIDAKFKKEKNKNNDDNHRSPL